MKVKPCIILLLIGMSFVIKAQIIITTPYEYAVGVSGGATFSSVTFSPIVPQNKKTGATVGLTGRITMGEYVGLQLELNFTQEGWKEKYDLPEEKDQNTVTQIDYAYSRLLNYVQMPFYTRVQFGGKNVKGFFVAGPQIGYMLSESTSENLNGAKPGKVNIQHDMPVQKKFEWGISGGGGIEIRTGKNGGLRVKSAMTKSVGEKWENRRNGIGYFLLEGRYLYSLGDIYNTRREDPFSKASGATIFVKLSYLFPLK